MYQSKLALILAAGGASAAGAIALRSPRTVSHLSQFTRLELQARRLLAAATADSTPSLLHSADVDADDNDTGGSLCYLTL